MRPSIVRIARNTKGWCFPGIEYRIEVFHQFGATSWQRVMLAAWTGSTVRGAVARYREHQAQLRAANRP